MPGFQNPLPPETVESRTYNGHANIPCVYVTLSTYTLNNRWKCYDIGDPINFTIDTDEAVAGKWCPLEVYLLSNGILELMTPPE
jgi:hypothetical protein